MDQNYKKEYYYNNTVLTAIDNNHAVLVIYIENLNNKSDGYCAPIAYLSNNCWLLYTSKHCNVIENHIFWCNCIKYEMIIDSYLLHQQWSVEINKIGWDFYASKEGSFKNKANKLISEAEEMAEKLISEAKDIIANSGDEREAVNAKLIQLLKDKKLEELELHLKSGSEIDINMLAMLEKYKSFAKEYNLKEGSEILSQFNTAKEEITTESKKQLSFIAKIQRYTDSIKENNAMVEAENYEKDGAFDEIDTKTTEYHDHGSEL